MDWHLVLSPVWSWPLIAFAAALLYGLVLVTYPSRIQALPTGRRRLMLGLRLMSATLLIVATVRPAIEYSEINERGAEIVFLLDQSRSMNTPDGPGGLTRRQQLLKTFEEIQKPLEALREKVDIRLIEYAETSRAVDKLEPPAEGRFTAIGLAIDELKKNASSKRLANVFLLGDGAQRATGEADIDPRTATRQFATQKSVPIHTVCYGTSEISTAGMDLAVEDLLVAPSTFERKIETVKAKIRMVGTPGQKVRVRLLIEDRTGKTLGQPGEWKELPLTPDSKPFVDLETNENATVMPVSLSFVAALPGEYKLALEARPLAGEVKTTNNRQESLISVSKGGLRVAYIDIPRVEQKFITRINESARIQLDSFYAPVGNITKTPKIEPEMFDAGRYDVYLIGDVPASAFQRDGLNLLDRLYDRVMEGAGLCMLGGQYNYSTGGYGTSRIAPLLPVKLNGAVLPAGQSDPSRQIRQKLQILPTADGNSHFLMLMDTNNNDQAWRSLPTLSGATRVEPRDGTVDILAESAEGAPLLIATDVGRSRVAALAIDETWIWHLHGRADVHQRFWQQMLLWLAHKDQDADQPVWVRVEPRKFAPGGKVPIEMGIRNPQGQPVDNGEYTVEVIGPKGSTKVTPSRQRTGATAEFLATTEPGDYWVRVSATSNGQPAGPTAITRFIIEARDPELDNPAADPDLMNEIATLTGAASIPPEKLGEFLETLLKSGISTELMTNHIVNLWDNWWLLGLFVAVMTVEWWLRKRNGLV